VQRNSETRKSITPNTLRTYRIFEPIPAGGCSKAAMSKPVSKVKFFFDVYDVEEGVL
jgi:hypothetical protein